MYKHVLVATDGSDCALRSARHGLGLAKVCGSRATALIVSPSWREIALSEIALGHIEAEYRERSEKYAAGCLTRVKAAAEELAIACETRHIVGERPYQQIVNLAAQLGCDLIVVGSHGRRGAGGILLGSETVKVLTHSSVPVLVYRE